MGGSANKSLVLIGTILGLGLVSNRLMGDEMGLASELPDPAAVHAYKEYWQTFAEYESHLLESARSKFNDSLSKTQEEYAADKKNLSEAQINYLKGAITKYKLHLNDHAEASNRPVVMLNLAQIQHRLAGVMQESDAHAGQSVRLEALGLLKDLHDNYRDFRYREEAEYLRAMVLESLNRQDESLVIWQGLAQSAPKTLYGVHGNIVYGDHLFGADNPKAAMDYYNHALALVDKVEAENKDYERVRIEYRLAWAAYRAADLEAAITNATALLKPGRNAKSIEHRQKLQTDAIELLGNALYELNNYKKFTRTLEISDLQKFGAAIGLKAARRFSESKIYDKTIAYTNFTARKFPTAAELPAILVLAADAYKSLGKEKQRAAVLERLAMLLPGQSLWRERHKTEFELIMDMEKSAKEGARQAAEYYYNHGLASGNANSYMAAAALYDTLLESEVQGELSNDYRLRRAHCYYFTDDLDTASKQYVDLRDNYKLNPFTLEIAAYQLVLTREKQWRKVLASKAGKPGDPKSDPEVIESLKLLDTAAEDFANRFPDKSRSHDLLLVAASANRDLDRYEPAVRYWERVLIAKPDPNQRSLAIRGLVVAALRTNNRPEALQLTQRFLKLEDWKVLGRPLQGEMLAILSRSTVDEGAELNKQGKVREAGLMMVQTAQEFRSMPDRDKIYRDGAYLLAIAGEWSAAQQAARDYRSAKLKGNAADMDYLSARAHEFQIRFGEAAKAYLNLAKNHADHSRALPSLMRAENLAIADDDMLTAAQAAELYGDRAKDRAQKLEAYQRAVDFYSSQNEHAKAAQVAAKRKQQSKSVDEMLSSDLLGARAMQAAGDESKALLNMEAIADKSTRQKETMSEVTHAEVSGESNFVLGAEQQARFDDFEIASRKGSIPDKVREKTVIFEKMAKRYDLAAAAAHPEWSSRARYQFAGAAESFADELTGIINTNGDSIGQRTKKTYSETATRLRELAKRYYSSNLLARSKRPDLYRENIWIKKSAIKLTGYGEVAHQWEHDHELPTPMRSDLPYQWSAQ